MFKRISCSASLTHICRGLGLVLGGCASPTEDPETNATVEPTTAADSAQPPASDEEHTGTTSSKIIVAPYGYGGFYGGMMYPYGYGYGYGHGAAVHTATVAAVATPGVWGAGMCGWGMPGCGW
jgi:hypothetical protein